jgi:hypothetical protein
MGGHLALGSRIGRRRPLSTPPLSVHILVVGIKSTNSIELDISEAFEIEVDFIEDDVTAVIHGF